MRRVIIVAAPIAVIVLTFVLAGVLQSLAPKPEQREIEVRPVAAYVENVELTTITPMITTQGEVRAQTEIDLISQIAGRIEMVSPSFLDGGSFRANETLVRIEDEDYVLAVTQAQARVAEARQALSREEAEAEMARRDWEELGEGDASDLALRKPQLEQARANLAAARAALQAAELNLRRTEISVPFDGRVRERGADIGQYVTPGLSLGRVFSTSVVEIRLPLTDRELGITGLPIGYNAPAGEGRLVELSSVVGAGVASWTGRLVRTSSAIDPETRTLFCIVEVPDPYGAGADNGVPLAVGLFVTAEIPGRSLENVLVIPRAALRSGDTVYVVDDEDKLEIRTVEVEFVESGRAVIKSGVSDGERVVVSPVEGAVQGMKLKPLRRDGSSAAIIEDTGTGDAS